MKLLTNLIFEPKGRHDPTLAYAIKDTVMSVDGSRVYFALQDVPAGTALTDTDFWKLQIDMHDTLVEMEESTVAAKAAATGAVSTSANQNLSESQKTNARQNIGMDKVIESLSDPLNASGNPLVVKPVGGMAFESVVTEFMPKQEGNGDPCPAGGGKNLMPPRGNSATISGITITSNADGSVTYNGTASADVNHRVSNYFSLPVGEYVLSGCPQGGSYETYNLCICDGAGNVIKRGFDSDIPVSLTEVFENLHVVVTIRKGTSVSKLTYYPMIRLASETDSTYAPYENIRPLSGWDAVNLNAAGKNLLPNNAASITKNGLTYTVNNDGSVTVNGTCDSNSFFTICESVELPQGEYILSGNPQGITYSQVRLYVDKYDSMTESHKFTLTAAQALTVNIVVYKGVVLNNAVFKPMIRSASDPDATYEPYQHNLHTVQIGETVYGGKLDWTTGKLVAEWAMVTLTSNLNWVKSGSAKNGFYLENGNVFVPAKLPYCPVVCNVARYVANVEDYRANYGTIYSDSTVSLNVNPAVCGDTLGSFKNWLDSTPVQIAYKLATPIEIQLDPTEIIALPGVNTLYGDGSITVTGRQPKTNALETRLAAIEAVITNA